MNSLPIIITKLGTALSQLPKQIMEEIRKIESKWKAMILIDLVK